MCPPPGPVRWRNNAAAGTQACARIRKEIAHARETAAFRAFHSLGLLPPPSRGGAGAWPVGHLASSAGSRLPSRSADGALSQLPTSRGGGGNGNNPGGAGAEREGLGSHGSRGSGRGGLGGWGSLERLGAPPGSRGGMGSQGEGQGQGLGLGAVGPEGPAVAAQSAAVQERDARLRQLKRMPTLLRSEVSHGQSCLR